MFSLSSAIRLTLLSCLLAISPEWVSWSRAHEQTGAHFEATRRVALAKAQEERESPSVAESPRDLAKIALAIRTVKTARPLGGLVRVTNVESGKAIELRGAIHREMNWYSVPADAELTVPATKLRIDVFHGIESERTSHQIDLSGKRRAEVELALPMFYDPRLRGEVSGNTHLHLKKLSYEGAIRYLETVPKSDGLDLVFLSHLRRIPAERTYISNLIVENDLQRGELARLSGQGVLFCNGEEHRHNFEAHNEGYGHVMLLNLQELIRPVSIGPGIMGAGTDGIPVQRGIRKARDGGATVIWCHGKYGMEDVPNWLEGLLHAQNIFDGGGSGGYDGSFYKYLNLGMHVPFSTGTDWFIYDFSRVVVPVEEKLSAQMWLAQLSAGRSYITNGTFLELQAGGRSVGDTIALNAAGSVEVSGRGIGRNDFGSLELVFNGDVVHTVASRQVDGHFEADLQFEFAAAEPGWLALRIPRNFGKNELDKELFAHTSPIYVEIGGKPVFRREVAQGLIDEIESNIARIRSLGVFEAGEEQAVVDVHRRAIDQLRVRLRESD